MISIKKFENTFLYYNNITLQEEFLKNYFEQMIDHIIKKGSLIDFQDLYLFVQKLPKNFNGYIKWKSLFELSTFKFANAEKISFILNHDKELSNNFNYLQILLRSGNEEHLSTLCKFKSHDQFFCNEDTFHVLFDKKYSKKLDSLIKIFNDNKQDLFKNTLINSMIKYAALHNNAEFLKQAVSFIDNDFTFRRTMHYCVDYFYNNYLYKNIVFMDNQQHLLKGFIVCNPDSYASLIKYTIDPKPEFFEVLDYVTPRMIDQYNDGFITTLEEINDIIFEERDYSLCKKILDLIAHHKPDMVSYLKSIYKNSTSKKIVHLSY